MTSHAVNNDGTDENPCFSKAEEGPSCSQSSTAADNSNQGRDSDSDSDSDQVSYSGRGSSVVATDCVVDIDNSVDEVRISVESETMERECRICMLSLDSEPGIAIELGCSCKDGMESAHQHCADTWFKSKGNNICEICNLIAQNVVVPNNTRSRQQISQVSTVSTNAVSVPVNEVNVVATFAVPMPVSQVNTSSTNAYSVPRSNVNSVSTNAASVTVSSTLNMPRSNVNHLSTNAASVTVSSTSNMPRSNVNIVSTTSVSVPASSTSNSPECSICQWLVFIVIFLYFLSFGAGRNGD